MAVIFFQVWCNGDWIWQSMTRKRVWIRRYFFCGWHQNLIPSPRSNKKENKDRLEMRANNFFRPSQDFCSNSLKNKNRNYFFIKFKKKSCYEQIYRYLWCWQVFKTLFNKQSTFSLNAWRQLHSKTNLEMLFTWVTKVGVVTKYSSPITSFHSSPHSASSSTSN